jgi:hypothetical protein
MFQTYSLASSQLAPHIRTHARLTSQLGKLTLVHGTNSSNLSSHFPGELQGRKRVVRCVLTKELAAKSSVPTAGKVLKTIMEGSVALFVA